MEEIDLKYGIKGFYGTLKENSKYNAIYAGFNEKGHVILIREDEEILAIRNSRCSLNKYYGEGGFPFIPKFDMGLFPTQIHLIGEEKILANKMFNIRNVIK
ncbi:hypothetical protein CMI39_01605 [Candidatus Pacearchaeota archaeon]|nr:hypothetical protein [Candidatus Pacearchaeota archaeon]